MHLTTNPPLPPLLKRVSIIEGFEPTIFEPKSLFSNSEGIERLIFKRFSALFRYSDAVQLIIFPILIPISIVGLFILGEKRTPSNT